MPDIAGNSLETATLINLTSSVQTFPDTVTPIANDYYRFVLANRSSFNLSLTGLTADANVALLTSAGNPLTIGGTPQISTNTGIFTESINATLDPGTYYIHVSPGTLNPADYSLNASISNTLSTDILWRNYADGTNTVWLLNGTSYSTFVRLPDVPGANWALQGSGDFNRDGSADLLWRDYTTGINTVWFFNGTSYSTFAFLQRIEDTNWRIQATGDFNQDGNVDIVWRNYATGDNTIWLMNGTTLNTFIRLRGEANLSFEIGGAGDFNSDGFTDLVWRNRVTGVSTVWFLNGVSYSTFALLPQLEPAWTLQGTGDFNSDGNPDLLWRNAFDGQNVIWLMNQTSYSTFVVLPAIPDLNWRSLSPFIRTDQPQPIDVAGNTPATAFNLGSSLTGSATYREQVGGADPNDFYQFNVGSASNVGILLNNLAANLDLQLVSGDGTTVLQASNLSGVTADSIIATLAAGTYYIRVFPVGSANSTYAVSLSINNLPVLATSNNLTVSEAGAATITNALLRVTDNDNTPAQITYTLGSLPNRGTLLLSGAALSVGSQFTQADIDNGTRLRYQHDGSETLTDSFNFTVSDGAGGNLALNTFSITVTPVNDPPVLATNNRLTLSEGAIANLTNTLLRVTDVDNTAAQLAYTLESTPTAGTLLLNGVALTAGTTFTQADIDNGTRLRYQHSGSETTTDSFSFAVSDGAGGTITSTLFNIAVTPVNDEPGLATNLPLTVSEGAFANLTNTLLRVTDNDNLASELRYTLDALPTTGTLLFNGTPVTLGSTFTQADIDNGTRLRYQHNGSETLTDNFSFTVSDGVGGTLGLSTFAIAVTPVNDAPILTLPTDLQSVDQSASVAIFGIGVNDPDAGNNLVTVTIAANSGVLSLASTANLSFSQGTGNQNTSMVFSGTLSAVNQALTALIYRGNPNFVGEDAISIAVSDNGNTGVGGPRTDSGTLLVAVTPVNQSPIITLPPTQTAVEDANLSIAGISIGDPDAGTGNTTVSLTVINGVLSLGATAGLTFLNGTTAQGKTIVFEAPLSLVNAALASLIYRGDRDYNGADSIVVSVSDSVGTGVSGVPLADTRTLGINVSAVNDPPVLSLPDVQTAYENTNLRITGLGINDVDAGSNTVTVNLSVASGTLTLNATTGLTFTSGNGNQNTSMIFTGTLAAVNSALSALTYRGNLNFNGTDTVTINVTDNGNSGAGIPLSASGAIAVNVLGTNSAPIITVPLAPTTTAATNLAIAGVGISDPDAGGGNLRVSIAAANGVLTIPTTGLFLLQGDGTRDQRITFEGSLGAINTALAGLVYRSNPGFTGFENIAIVVNDLGNAGIGSPLSDIRTLFVNVGGATNNPPVANADTYTTSRNGVLNIAAGTGVLTNDTDADGNPLNATLLTSTPNGTLIFNSNGSFTYTPNPGFAGLDTFTYRATDGIGNSNPATVNISVTVPLNTAPIANPDIFVTNEDATLFGSSVLANDTDPDANLPLVAQLIGGPANARSFNLNSDGSFTYIPIANFNGNDSFTYIARDALGAASGTATVSLVVNPQNDAPIGVADTFTFAEDTTTATGNVLTNDTDPENDLPLTAQLNSVPSRAQSFTLNSDGSFTYIPAANFNGTDSFTYVVRDALGATSTPTTVSLTITPVNDAPIAVNDSFTVTAGGTLSGSNVLTNDTDVEDTRPQTAALVTGPAGAAVFTLNPDGTFTYVPNAGVTSDSFTYIARDAGGLGSNTATVNITVSSAVNAPPIALADVFTIAEDTTFTAGNVLSNDIDTDNNLPLTAQLIGGPASAQSFTLNNNGSFTYIPTANFNGSDRFTYIARDALGASSGTTTVDLTITPVNDAPIAVNDSFTITAGGTLTGNSVLTNDTDIEDTTPQTATLIAGPAGAATFTLNPNGTFTYVPNAGVTSDSFTYIARDAGGLDSNTATVNISVTTTANIAPVANPDVFTIAEDSTFTTGNVLSNDTDLDNSLPLTAQLIGGPASAQSFTLNSDGSFTYIPTANFNGTDSFTYIARDALGASSGTATVSMTVTPVNDAPVAVNDIFSVTAGGTLTTSNVLLNDTDIEDTRPQTAALVTGPTNAASFTLNADGSFTYVPNAGAATDSFTYIARDASGLDSNTATVNINVTTTVNTAPIANADVFTIAEDTTLNTGNVLTNDTDAENNLPLTALLIGGPARAQSFTLNADGSFTYLPNANFSGGDRFTYVAIDSLGASSGTATVSITITPVNDAPVAVNDLFSVTVGGTLSTGNVLLNDTDVEDTIVQTATLIAGPTGAATFTLNPNGTFTYVPNAGVTSDRFTYIAVDSNGLGSNTATVDISITSTVNVAPTATADVFTIAEDATFTIGNVLSNDADPDNNIPLTAALVGGPASAQSFTLNSDGSFTYIPTANFNGTDSFTYIAQDALGASSGTATVNLTITPVNDAPVAVNDVFTVTAGGTLTGSNVLTNDTDIEDTRPQTATLVTAPTNAASFTLNADGTFTYVPNTGVTTDSFTYVASDAGGLGSNTATVNISVSTTPNVPPTASADIFTIAEDTTFTVGNVLSNDADPDNNIPLTAVLVGGPTNAQSFTLNSDGTFTYIPTTNFNGTDNFTYIARDSLGGNSNTATVTINLTPVNDAPVAVNDTFTLAEDGTLTTQNVLSNDTDADSDTPLTVQQISGPANAQSFTLNSDGTFTYIPTANFSGVDQFTYVVRDPSNAVSNTATANITITPVNDPPVASNDTYRAVTNTPLTVTTLNSVLNNDTDVENDPRTAIAGVRPTTAGGTVTLNADGSFIYTPATGFAGTDTFTYQATDGTSPSNTATVTLNVGANAAPVANPDTGYRVAPGATLTVGAAVGVLTNDSDADGDRLTAVPGVRTSAGNGTVTLNADGSFSYTPATGFTGTDTFTYQATDGFVPSTATTVSITVAANTAPIAAPDVYRTGVGAPLSVDVVTGVLGNDSDVDGDLLTAIAGVQTTTGGGTVTLSTDGSFFYTPATGFTGADTFTYQATDGTTPSLPATVTITVSNNALPIANADTYQVPAGAPFTVGAIAGVLNNDTDVDGDSLTAVAGARSTTGGGTVTLSADGAFVYTPATGFTGFDTFTYQATDGNGNSAPATVTLSVFTNTAPVAIGETYNTTINRSVSITAPGILANDTDVEGNALVAIPVNPTVNGNLVLSNNGSFVYTPNAGFTGIDTFTYRVSDGFTNSGIATTTISVATNLAPTANPDTYSVNQNNVLTVPYNVGTTTIAGVLSNDVDTDPLTASVVSSPSQGTLTLNSDGSFVYTPNAGVGGVIDTFIYRASDGTLSSTATVTVSIRNSSTAPIAAPETFSIGANSTLSVTTGQSLLLNDTDADGDRLTARVTRGPANGTLTLNTNGTFTYIPNANFTSIDTFVYVANDGIADSNPTTVSITVGAVNSPPVLSLPGSQAVFRNTDLFIASGLSISDPDAGTNPVQLTLTATNGSLNLSTTNGLTILDADGDRSVVVQGSLTSLNTALTNLRYRPDTDYTGSDVISVTVNDQGNTGVTGGPQTASGNIQVNVSSGATLVADINQTGNTAGNGTESASPTNLIDANGVAYFAATNGVDGVELWRSDGTSGGTALLANINPTLNGSSNPANFTVVGSNLFFSANDGTNGTELWKTDLTTGVTTLVRNIRPLSAGSTPTNLVNFNNTLFFRANDGSGTALWRSDGTTAGTVKVGAAAGYTFPASLTVAGSTLFFTASNGTQLWKTDGTDAGTVLVRDLGATGASSLVAIGNTLFFTATDSTNGSELWRSDGTSAGTTRISNISPGTGDANPTNLVNLGGTLYFFANNGTSAGLYRSTAAGVVSLVQALPSSGQAPGSLTVVGSTLFFTVDVGTAGTPDVQLWKSDGTTASLLRDINLVGNAAPASLTNVNGTLFFTANDGATRVWLSDGTEAGTIPVSSTFSSSVPTNLTAVGSRLFFTAETLATGNELWVL